MRETKSKPKASIKKVVLDTKVMIEVWQEVGGKKVASSQTILIPKEVGERRATIFLREDDEEIPLKIIFVFESGGEDGPVLRTGVGEEEEKSVGMAFNMDAIGENFSVVHPVNVGSTDDGDPIDILFTLNRAGDLLELQYSLLMGETSPEEEDRDG